MMVQSCSSFEVCCLYLYLHVFRYSDTNCVLVVSLVYYIVCVRVMFVLNIYGHNIGVVFL